MKPFGFWTIDPTKQCMHKWLPPSPFLVRCSLLLTCPLDVVNLSKLSKSFNWAYTSLCLLNPRHQDIDGLRWNLLATKPITKPAITFISGLFYWFSSIRIIKGSKSKRVEWKWLIDYECNLLFISSWFSKMSTSEMIQLETFCIPVCILHSNSN